MHSGLSASYDKMSTHRAQISDKAADYCHNVQIRYLESQPSDDAPSKSNIHKQSKHSEN